VKNLSSGTRVVLKSHYGYEVRTLSIAVWRSLVHVDQCMGVRDVPDTVLPDTG
jgi:hypothetical protein